MKSILVIGLGHFGRHIINKLNELGTQIMAVDILEENVSAIADKVDSAQIGNTTNEEFLRSKYDEIVEFVIAPAGSLEARKITP